MVRSSVRQMIATSVCTCAAVVVVSGCGGGQHGKNSTASDAKLARPAPAAVGDTAVESSNLLIDDEGRTYVLIPADGAETDMGSKGSRPHEGAEGDTASNVAQIARLTPAGTLDSSYGFDGHVTLRFKDGEFESFRPQRIAAVDDETLIIAGSVELPPVSSDGTEPRDAGEMLGLIRASWDGDKDEGFGTKGSLALDLPDIDVDDEALMVTALLPDETGTTIVVRRSGLGGTGTSLLRLDASGEPDRSTWYQGSEEMFNKDLPNGFDPIGAAQNADGDTYLSFLDGAGPLSPPGAKYDHKMRAAESVDAPFEVQRDRAIRSANGIRSFAVTSDGSYLFSSALYDGDEVKNSTLVTRQDADGAPDADFGMGGLEAAEITHRPDGTKAQLPGDTGVTWIAQDDMSFPSRMTVDDEGAIYVAGAGGPSSPDVRIVKLDRRGRLAKRWADDGVASAEFPIADSHMYRQPVIEGLQLLKDGGLLVLVSQSSGPYFGRAIYRLTKSGALASKWGKNGRAVVTPTIPK